jgi:hypothetical protein
LENQGIDIFGSNVAIVVAKGGLNTALAALPVTAAARPAILKTSRKASD